MRGKTVAAVVAGVVLLLGLATIVLAAPVLWLVLDESAVPPVSDMPTLPEGTTAAYQGVGCGSGGCWREWTLSATPPLPGSELAATLDRPGDTCAARNLLDRREVCTSVDVIGGEARLYVQFDRPWD